MTGQLRIWCGDDNDRSIAERDNLARFLQHIVAFHKTIYVTQESDIRTFVIDKSTVEDGKDESGKVKTKTVTRIHETDRLLSSGKDWILRLAIQKDWIVAGTECGEILVWDRTQNQPKHRFVAKP